jgi:putative SOS response-associated peptidase YedK
MCGRYILFTAMETLLTGLSERLGEQVTALPGDWLRPSWNIAPTHRVAVVRRFGGRFVLGPAVWGFPAPWKPGTVLFNARGETAFDKASFRNAEPALVVMDGWYEWNAVSGTKTPYLVTGDGPLVVAGLVTRDEEGELRATVVTTASADPVEWLHDRMPRVLADDEAAVWLDGGEELRETASRVPGAQVREELTTCPVDRRVGNVAVNRPELIRGTGDAEATMGE